MTLTPTILSDVHAERARQEAKWGEQNHPNGTGERLMITDTGYTALDQAIHAKNLTDALAKRGTLTYFQILLEEVLEANVEEDPVNLRAELVQVAAVAVAWIECIDRRAAKSDGRSRSSFIARAAVLAATRQSTERRNLERHLEVALAEVDRLTAALAESEAIPLRMIRAAKGGASDYLGGYCDFHLDVFRHGMDTIVSVIEAAAKMDPTDYQTRANVAMRAALTATEKP